MNNNTMILYFTFLSTKYQKKILPPVHKTTDTIARRMATANTASLAVLTTLAILILFSPLRKWTQILKIQINF